MRSSIESIEGLNRIDLPQLKNLTLTFGYFKRITDFKKAYWKNLYYINLSMIIVTKAGID